MVLLKTNKLSNQFLQAIANNTSMMVNKLGNGQSSSKPVIVNASPPQTQQNTLSPVGDNRIGYANSPYSLSH
jgi:hypothetical protein